MNKQTVIILIVACGSNNHMTTAILIAGYKKSEIRDIRGY